MWELDMSLNLSIHPTDSQWDILARQHFKDAYPELVHLFRNLLGRSFLLNHWIPDPLALDYLTKILICFLPVSTSKELVDTFFNQQPAEVDDPRDIIRFYERTGEFILWWSGIQKKPVFQAEGKRSFEIAYERLSDFEIPKKRFIIMPGQEEDFASKRLKVNKMFSDQFENYQAVLEQSDILDDPAYRRFRELFMTDDFSIN